MIIAIVGSGGKTTLLKKLAAQFRAQGKKVLVTTSTHMFIEEDTLLTDDPAVICSVLEQKGYAMAGIPEGEKIRALSEITFRAASSCAHVVLVEADGSKHMPLKYPNASEPVIPEGAEQILVVCGLNAIGRKAKEVCHRLELVTTCLGIAENTCITEDHVRKLVVEGYLKPLRGAHPRAKIILMPRHDGSETQKALAEALSREDGWDCQEFFKTEWKSAGNML